MLENETEYMTIPKLAIQLEVSGNTARRYIESYPQFFGKPKLIDGWEQYETKKAIPILKRIRELSKSGQRKSKVLDTLTKEIPVEYETPSEVYDIPFTSGKIESVIVKLGEEEMKVLTDIRDILRKTCVDK